MNEAALYILTGLTLYAGGHHLYLDLGAGRRDSDRAHLQLGALYWLLAGFAMTSAMTYQSTNLAVLLPTGKLEISFGILLWLAVLWHVALRSGVKPLIVLDLLTAVWLIFLVRNLIEPNSLLYTDVTPVNQTLMSGQTLDLFFTSISPWWTAVELAMLASLLFCYYAGYRLYREGRREAALILLAGAVLLGLVTLHDHLVSIMFIEAGYLAPFGFLLFLLPASLYPLWQTWRTRHSAPLAPVVYNLAYMPDQASFHTDVSQLRTLLRPETGATRVASGHDDSNDRIPTVDQQPRQARPAVRAVEMPVETPKPAAPAVQADAATVTAVTDSLIDIAVFATMALNRFKRGDADPQTLESLCRKIRTQAIKTRRLTHKLLPDDLQDKDQP